MDSLLIIISTIALILSLTGNIMVNFKKRSGFIVWGLSNIVWIIVNLIGPINVPQIIMYLVYMGLNIHGFVLWRHEDKK